MTQTTVAGGNETRTNSPILGVLCLLPNSLLVLAADAGRPKQRSFLYPYYYGIPCDECGQDVSSGYVHMLKDKIWKSANHGKMKGVLCMSCIEKNLGRKLVQADFFDQSSFRKLQIRKLI